MVEEIEAIEMNLKRFCIYKEDLREEYRTKYHFIAQTDNDRDIKETVSVDIALTDPEFILDQKFRILSRLTNRLAIAERSNKFNLKVNQDADAYRVVYRVRNSEERAIVLRKQVHFDKEGNITDIQLTPTTTDRGNPNSRDVFARYDHTCWGIKLYPKEIPDHRTTGYQLLDIREIYA